MSDEPMSETDLIAYEQRRARRERVFLYLVFAFIVYMTVTEYLPLAWQLQNWPKLYGILAVAAAFALRILLVRQPSIAARDEKVVRKLSDDHQLRVRLSWLMMLILLLHLALTDSRSITTIAEGIRTHRLPSNSFDPSPFMTAGFFILCAVGLYSGNWLIKREFRAAVNDELTRALRGRALAAGYLFAMCLLAGAFVTIMVTQVNAAQLLLWLMFAGVAVPVLYFLFLDWRASRGG